MKRKVSIPRFFRRNVDFSGQNWPWSFQMGLKDGRFKSDLMSLEILKSDFLHTFNFKSGVCTFGSFGE